ncbi:MAG: DUF2178 domain-containing protein [Candidatus Buchananbacteria bacterium]
MTLKRYQQIRLGTVVILAIVFSQAIIFKNYILPIAVLIVASLVLMYLRRQVKEVIADERDYLTGGRAALWAIQIYAWTATIAMFIFYALRDINPAYEPIAIVLAFSTCLLMLLYSVIYRYYNKIKLTDKKSLYIVLIVILFLVLAVFALRLFSGEDNWLCQNGEWVKHGQPDFPAPKTECK